MAEVSFSPNLRVYRWDPLDVDVWASMLFLPGQGDVASRYREILEPLIDAGIRVFCFDWPGHGHSEGRRGHVGTLDEARSLVDSIFQEMSESSSGIPLGIGGHSMGGLMALDFLRRKKSADFSYLSSPLLVPEHEQSKWLIAFAKVLGTFLPFVTVDNGVRIGDCVRGGDVNDSLEQAGEILKGQGHSRISLGWGLALMEVASEIRSAGSGILEGCSVIASQGTDDSVCRLEFFSDFFGEESTDLLELVFIAGARHEPFSDELSSDSVRKLLVSAAESWKAHFGKSSESQNRA